MGESYKLAREKVVLSKLSLKFVIALLAFGILQPAEPLLAQQEPELSAIAAAGRETLDRLEREPAAWNAVFELPNGAQAIVKVISAVTTRRIDIGLGRVDKPQWIVRIIQRDGLWYVSHQFGHFKYRPYEAPLGFAALYVFLARSELRTIVDDSEPLGSFDRLQGTVATYRTALPATLRQQLQANLVNLLKLEQSDPEKMSAKLRQTKQKLQQGIRNGTELKVNVETGVLEQYGSVGQHCWIRDFRWLKNADGAVFDVSGQQWEDRSSSIVTDEDTRNEVIMICNAMDWQSGQRLNDPDLLLFNISSGQSRRVPYAPGVAANGCFSQDRLRVYVAGQIPDLGSLGIFEIDLETGEHRHLGGRDLEFGITMFPTLSPNGRYLAAIHGDPASGPLNSQVHIIDIASGRSKAIGKPLDTGRLSWLPSGDGLVLVSREHQTFDVPAVSTICQLDFRGNLTTLRQGDFPVVLPDSRILFLDREDDQWKTCDLQGQDVELVGDGLKSFSLPAPSPDGKRMIMMKFVGSKGLQPHLVDLATGKTQAIPVSQGLWLRPCWR